MQTAASKPLCLMTHVPAWLKEPRLRTLLSELLNFKAILLSFCRIHSLRGQNFNMAFKQELLMDISLRDRNAARLSEQPGVLLSGLALRNLVHLYARRSLILGCLLFACSSERVIFFRDSRLLAACLVVAFSASLHSAWRTASSAVWTTRSRPAV